MKQLFISTIIILLILLIAGGSFWYMLAQLASIDPRPIDDEANLEYLSTFAENKLNDLLNTDNWSHTNSDGCDFACRTEGHLGAWVGEDLYKGPCSLKMAYEMWQDSPTHKRILDLDYDNMVILSQQKGDMCYIVYEALKN